MLRMPLAALAALWMSTAQAIERPCTLVSDVDYLYSLYERAPKKDSGGYFGWKDEVAAARAGMTLKDYVIGGMSPELRSKLAQFFFRAEVAGLRPSINSAFRDDYRQRLIKQSFKAGVGLSFHGGSKRGGWGSGAAVDAVSEDATSDQLKERIAASEPLWKFTDEHGKEFGLGRPYRRMDPSHIALLSSGERGGRIIAKIKRAAKRMQLAKK